jgi:HK97 family phage prohead protease
MPKPNILSEEQFREAAKAGTVADAQLRKAFVAEVKAMDAERSLDFVISTDTVDRMGDTIDVQGWDLGNYRKNPVVLWAHDSSLMPVAKASNIRVEDGKLKARAEFMPADMSTFADSVFRALKGGFLSAVSVGFAPVKYAFSDEPGRSFGIDFLQQELLEFSVCPVPANPEALIEARSAGIDIAPIREWAVKLLAGENLALIDTARLAAISALPEEFRTDAQKASGSKGASGLYRRCANRIERALKGEETTSDPALHPAEPIADLPVTQPQTLTLEMARRRLALLG